jgi:hypothetical protein
MHGCCRPECSLDVGIPQLNPCHVFAGDARYRARVVSPAIPRAACVRPILGSSGQQTRFARAVAIRASSRGAF